jgi:hypothetical protein
MKGAKSSSQKRKVELPPQQSASDTSNWDGRNVSAPTVDKVTKQRVVRETVFVKGENQSKEGKAARLLLPKLSGQNRTKKPSK